MRKKLILTLLLIVGLLTGCSSNSNYKVAFTKPLYFQKDKDMPFEIKITENKKAVKGLAITAEFSMANMDHGTADVKLTEAKSGTYSGKVELPMNGKYEVAFTLEKNGKKVEKVINYTVKKPEGIASINGNWIKNDDLAFYQFINKLQSAINREAAEKKYTGKQLEEELAFLDSQEKTLNDKNQLLTQIIRLRSMAMLAEEKGHKATTAEVNQAIENARGQYNQFTSATKLIKDFGEEKFWSIEEQQYKDIVLTQKVQKDLLDQVKKENPKAGEQELYYQAQQKYEELLVSQINSLKIEIL